MKKQTKKKNEVVSPPADHPYKVGQKYFIRTVTMYHLGRLVAVHPQELVLEDASWVADAGKLGELLEKGNPPHVEPYPDGAIFVNRGGIIDVCDWPFALPRPEKKEATAVEGASVPGKLSSRGAASGRLSSDTSNMANAPREIKD